MPAYELFLLVKQLERPALVKSIKKGAEVILENKGIIRSFENLGFKKLPYRMKKHTDGNYILVKFDIPSKNVNAVMSEVAKNDDYIRYGISPLLEYDEDHEETCICKEKGVFMKNSFNFMNPMTAWDKKKIYKNYGLRL